MKIKEWSYASAQAALKWAAVGDLWGNARIARANGALWVRYSYTDALTRGGAELDVRIEGEGYAPEGGVRYTHTMPLFALCAPVSTLESCEDAPARITFTAPKRAPETCVARPLGDDPSGRAPSLDAELGGGEIVDDAQAAWGPGALDLFGKLVACMSRDDRGRHGYAIHHDESGRWWAAVSGESCLYELGIDHPDVLELGSADRTHGGHGPPELLFVVDGAHEAAFLDAIKAGGGGMSFWSEAPPADTPEQAGEDPDSRFGRRIAWRTMSCGWDALDGCASGRVWAQAMPSGTARATALMRRQHLAKDHERVATFHYDREALARTAEGLKAFIKWQAAQDKDAGKRGQAVVRILATQDEIRFIPLERYKTPDAPGRTQHDAPTIAPLSGEIAGDALERKELRFAADRLLAHLEAMLLVSRYDVAYFDMFMDTACARQGDGVSWTIPVTMRPRNANVRVIAFPVR